jgi:hypothetical protein
MSNCEQRTRQSVVPDAAPSKTTVAPLTKSAPLPARRDLSVSALQTIYCSVACSGGLSDGAHLLEAIAREDA